MIKNLLWCEIIVAVMSYFFNTELSKLMKRVSANTSYPYSSIKYSHGTEVVIFTLVLFLTNSISDFFKEEGYFGNMIAIRPEIRLFYLLAPIILLLVAIYFALFIKKNNHQYSVKRYVFIFGNAILSLVIYFLLYFDNIS